MSSPDPQETEMILPPPSALSVTSIETFAVTENSPNVVEDDDEFPVHEVIPSLTDDQLLPEPFTGQLAHIHVSKAFTFNILGKLFDNSSCREIKKYFQDREYFPDGEPLLAHLLRYGMTISTRSLGMNPKVMITYFVRMFRKMKKHYIEGLPSENLEAYKIPEMEGKRYPFPTNFVMLHYPRLNARSTELCDTRLEFKTEEDYIPYEEISDVVDILQDDMAEFPYRGGENSAGENPTKKKQGQGKRSSTPDSKRSSPAPKKTRTSAGPKKADSFQNLSTAKMAEIFAKRLSQEENKDTKSAKTLNKYKRTLWESEIRAERLYSDYCSLYDALFLSAFHRSKPKNESDLEEFFTKYLMNKSPQWSSHGGYMTVFPVSVSIAQDNTPIETFIKDLNERRVKLMRKKNLLDLSKIRFPLPSYSPEQEEKLGKLMYSPNKYVSKKSHEKSLGIAEERVVDEDLNVIEALKDYKETQKDPVDFRQYFPKEDGTLPESMDIQM